MFPKRFVDVMCPEYPDLKFKLLANPDGRLYQALLNGTTRDDESAAALGAALVEAYAGGRYEGYGAVLDFATADSAIATVMDEALPIDLRTWIRNAPIDIVDYQRSAIEKNFQRSLIGGNDSRA